MIASSIRSKDEIDFCLRPLGRGDVKSNMGVFSTSRDDDDDDDGEDKRFVDGRSVVLVPRPCGEGSVNAFMGAKRRRAGIRLYNFILIVVLIGI
jgi:hypothetical protein